MPIESNDATQDTVFMERVSKLFAKATATDNEHEAQLFMGKVQALLMERNLSISHLQSYKSQGKNDVQDDALNLNDITNRKEGDWAKELLWGICDFNMCKGIRRNHPGKDDMGVMFIIGTPNSIEVCKQMIGYLVPTVKAWHRRAWKEYDGDQKPGAYKRDFLIACVRRLRARMLEITLANKRELEKSSGENVTALMVVNNAAIDAYTADKFTLNKPKMAKPTKHRDGAYAGDDAGRKISLNNQIGSSSPKGHIS